MRSPATAALLALATLGCSSTATTVRDAAAAPTPDSPLRRLEHMVGTWEGTGELVSPRPTDPAEPMVMRGGSTTHWALGGRYLVSEGWHDTPAGRTTFVQYVAWDPGAKKFRAWFFGDTGEFGEGCWTVSEDGRSVEVEVTSHDPHGVEKNGGGATVFRNDDTVSWTWSEWGEQGPVELRGTSQRVR